MELNELDIIILSGVVFFLLLSFFIVYFIVFYRKKQFRNIQEKERMVAEFDQTLLQTRLEIQEQTFLHIGQELHDNIGQVLSLVSLNLNTIPSPESDKLSFTSDLLDKAIKDLRDLGRELNSDRIEHIGLIDSICEELAIMERSNCFKTKEVLRTRFELESGKRSVILFRIIQEVLNNIIKHSGAACVTVVFDTLPTGYLIAIKDDGKGFSVAEALEKASGSGLANIYSRAKLVRTEVSIESKLERGTEVNLFIQKI